MSYDTQSNIAMKIAPIVIVDDETMDNELYFEMLQEEKASKEEQIQFIRNDANEFKKDFLNSLFEEIS